MVKVLMAVAFLTMGQYLSAAYVEYEVGGSKFQSYHTKPTGKVSGTVLLIHDWDGIDKYEEKRAEMLRSAGYQVFAVDLYGKGNRPQSTKAKKAEVGKLYQDRKKMRRLILAGIAEAKKLGGKNFVVMGYCFGGAATLELARSGQGGNAVKGYASFHGGLSTPEGQKYPQKVGPLFIAHGGADSMIPLSHVAKIATDLETVQADYEIEIYSAAPHGFTVFGSSKYQKQADEKSWSSFLKFLERSFAAKMG